MSDPCPIHVWSMPDPFLIHVRSMPDPCFDKIGHECTRGLPSTAAQASTCRTWLAIRRRMHNNRPYTHAQDKSEFEFNKRETCQKQRSTLRTIRIGRKRWKAHFFELKGSSLFYSSGSGADATGPPRKIDLHRLSRVELVPHSNPDKTAVRLFFGDTTKTTFLRIRDGTAASSQAKQGTDGAALDASQDTTRIEDWFRTLQDVAATISPVHGGDDASHMPGTGTPRPRTP